MVEVLNPGKTLPSDVHERADNGRLKAIPCWRIGQPLGYAFVISRSSVQSRSSAPA
jgi:hypothetical protein